MQRRTLTYLRKFKSSQQSSYRLEAIRDCKKISVVCEIKSDVICWDLSGMPPIYGGDAETCGSALFFDEVQNVAANPTPENYLVTPQDVIDSLNAGGFAFYIDPLDPDVICLNSPWIYPTFVFTDAYQLSSSTGIGNCQYDVIGFTAPILYDTANFTINGASFSLNKPAPQRTPIEIPLFADHYGKEQEFFGTLTNIDLTFIIEVLDHSTA